MIPSVRSVARPRHRAWIWWSVLGLLGAGLLAPPAAADDARYRAYLQYRAKDSAPFTGDCGNGAGPLRPGIYRVQIVADEGPAAMDGAGWSVLGFGVSLGEGEAVTRLSDLNADAKDEIRPPATGVEPGNLRPQPLSVGQGTVPLLQDLAALFDGAATRRAPLIPVLRLLCRSEARPLGDSDTLVLIHRLLAADAALSARDLTDLWAFYAPGQTPPPEAGDAALLALARRYPAFLSMANYGGRTSSRHRELHDAFVASLTGVRIAGLPAVGEPAPEPSANPRRPDGSGEALVDQRIREAMAAHWSEIVRPPLTAAVVIALLALATAATLLALLLKLRAAAAGDRATLQAHKAALEGLAGIMATTRQRQQDELHRTDVGRQDLERRFDGVAADLADLRRMVERLNRAAEQDPADGRRDGLRDELMEWRRSVDSKLLKVELSLSDAARPAPRAREAGEPVRPRLPLPPARPAEAVAPLPMRLTGAAAEAAPAPPADARFSEMLRLAELAGARPADLAAVAGRLARADASPQLVAKELIMLLPLRPDPGICRSLGDVLAEVSHHACELIVPTPDTPFSSTEHEIGEYEPARRGDINRVVALLRPGLRIDGRVLMKARVSLPN